MSRIYSTAGNRRSGLTNGLHSRRDSRDMAYSSDGQDDFIDCLAEALGLLAVRSKSRGLHEIAHLLDVASLAAREAAEDGPKIPEIDDQLQNPAA